LAKVDVPRDEPETEGVEGDGPEKVDDKIDEKTDDKPDEASLRGGSRASRAAARVARAKALVESRKMLDEGERLLRAQHFSEARDVFTKLTKLKPLRGSALVGLAEISFQEKKYDEAVRSAKLAAKGGGGVRARVLLGDAHFRLSQYKEAVDAYEQALKLEPANSSAKSGLSLASKRM
jgi:tetratricopeptide (TPR) repeat protein